MAFLRNCWYAAAWSHEVSRSMLPRKLLGEPVVMFRRNDGSPAALADRCPHRFVPLHRGKLVGDTVQCGYHGLCFDSAGRCTSNPHGDGKIPAGAAVRSYPLTERFGMLWIWMGDTNLADPAALSDFPPFEVGGDHVAVHGYLNVGANYQLFGDNLMDLTHVQYVHPAFADPTSNEPPEMLDSLMGNDAVWARYQRPPARPNKHFQWLGFPADELGRFRSNMRWTAPCNFFLDVGVTGVGEGTVVDVSKPTLHLLTPETETTTHYFWAVARTFKKDDESFGDELQKLHAHIFETEDKPIVELQQAAMGAEVDLFKMKPVLLATDKSAVRVRRLLNERIQAERSSA